MFSKARLAQGVPLFLVCGLMLFRLRAFLPLDTLPARGDPSFPYQGSDLTPVWAGWTRIELDAVKHQGVLPFWNPFAYAGAPLFEAPQVGVFSLATALGLVFPPEAALKWSMVLHVLLGVAGTAVLVRKLLGLTPACSALGGLVFGLGPFLLHHFRVGHPSLIYPMTLMPWALFAFWRSLGAVSHGYRWALLSGLTIGIQILEGGDGVVLYEAIALALVPSAIAFIPSERRVRFALRATAMGLLTGMAAFTIAAFQLLPMLSYLPGTDRAACLPWEFSSEPVREVAHPIPGPMLSSFLGVGLWSLWKDKKAFAGWFSSVLALSVSVAFVVSVFRLLWLYLPGFCHQRIPARSLMLVGIFGPLVAAEGVQKIWRLVEARFPRWKYVVVVAVAALVLEMWVIATGTPPMASVKKELESNAAMNWLSQHAGQDRIHVWESSNRHWGTEHVTVPLGLQVIAGYTPTENPDYLPYDFMPHGHRTFLEDSYRQPAKLWGLLNVRYVLSTQPRSEDGFHLAAHVAKCPLEICQPAKSSGPWIYENERLLPRAFQVRHSLAIVGEPRRGFETAMDVLELPELDPGRTVIIQVRPNDTVPPVDLAISAKDEVVSGLKSWSDPDCRQQVRQFLLATRDEAGFVTAEFARPNINQMQIRTAMSGWLVVSERLGLFPGWSAAMAGQPLKIFRANGVLGALPVPSPGSVNLRYRPQGLDTGIWILVAGLAIVAAVEALGFIGARGKAAR